LFRYGHIIGAGEVGDKRRQTKWKKTPSERSKKQASQNDRKEGEDDRRGARGLSLSSGTSGGSNWGGGTGSSKKEKKSNPGKEKGHRVGQGRNRKFYNGGARGVSSPHGVAQEMGGTMQNMRGTCGGRELQGPRFGRKKKKKKDKR